jgi:hypothetical protein
MRRSKSAAGSLCHRATIARLGRRWRHGVGVLVLALPSSPLSAQERPLVTQDPETVGAGKVLIEGGIVHERNITFPLSGLQGNLWRLPVIGIDVGISTIADLQLTGGPYDRLSILTRQAAPLAASVTATGDTTHDVDDVNLGVKIRFVPETASTPGAAFRFSTRLPNAKHASGLGQDTTDLSASILLGKSVQPLRLVGNIGWTIMSEPLDAAKQNDVLTYGLSLTAAVARSTALVGEINGWVSTRNGPAPVGTESRGRATLGAWYRTGALRFDAGILLGLTKLDPTVGITAGVTYIIDAFTAP